MLRQNALISMLGIPMIHGLHCKMWDDMKNGYVDRRDIDLLIFLALMNTVAALCIVVDLRNAHVSSNWQMRGQTSHSLNITQSL